MISRTEDLVGPVTVELSGTPKEIGIQHGRQLSPQIHSQIKVYDSMFQTTSKLQWSDVRALAEEYRGTIEKLTPDIYTEMQGIAEGADLDILDIVALNCRSEIALGHFSDGCTSLGWKTQKDGVILAQNWDWTARVKENLVFMAIEQPGKPKISMVTEAGIVGKIGFNSESVGVCLNAIRAKPTDSKKIPIHVALRVCLESTSAKTAIEKLEALGNIASAQHILVADINGPTSLELSPVGNIYIQPNDQGLVCHTNHFIKNRYVNEPPWLKGSPIRLERCQKLAAELMANNKALTGDVLREKIFSDCFNAPQAIACQADPSRPIATRSSTLFCIIMRFVKDQKPSAEVVWGTPGSGEEGPVLHMPW